MRVAVALFDEVRAAQATMTVLHDNRARALALSGAARRGACAPGGERRHLAVLRARLVLAKPPLGQRATRAAVRCKRHNRARTLLRPFAA